VIKTEKQPVINGGGNARFKVCLIHGIKRGGGGNGRRMQCRARGSGSMAGEARAAGALPSFGAEGGRRGWVDLVDQKAEQAGRRLGQNLKRNPFQNKK
jgi:hypothetical protein